MPGRDKAKIIRALSAAYLSNDRAAIEESFTEDFRFTGPYDNEIDKPTYFAVLTSSRRLPESNDADD